MNNNTADEAMHPYAGRHRRVMMCGSDETGEDQIDHRVVAQPTVAI
jgi:hypothetical protein